MNQSPPHLSVLSPINRTQVVEGAGGGRLVGSRRVSSAVLSMWMESRYAADDTRVHEQSCSMRLGMPQIRRRGRCVGVEASTTVGQSPCPAPHVSPSQGHEQMPKGDHVLDLRRFVQLGRHGQVNQLGLAGPPTHRMEATVDKPKHIMEA
ncbi:Aste57867_17566 [Aphanomyces stellatus]|uniref:Aste57867_17566 protein n=1 Tax=Aphanomyces stellatus TaxID=120398 RepID=A0A485L857_9STRA|nr:hypothetical protein As57867_017506 [Aphanomyces stellatus]VFT94317.1 Aste57867_17566 [Aphanomyces stellatus]